MILEIDRPAFFPLHINAGVVKRNVLLNVPYGLSVNPTNSISIEDAEQHRIFIAKALGFAPERMKYQRQTHGTIIRTIQGDSAETESDAMITNEYGLALCVKIADCCAVLLHDARTNAIAGIHSGWKGTRSNIVAQTVNEMRRAFSAEASDLKAYISACAGAERYEVGEEFLEYFPNTIRQINKKYYFDNKNEIRTQLIGAGIISENIEISSSCTISDEAYHSYRRDKEESGRMIAYISIINRKVSY